MCSKTTIGVHKSGHVNEVVLITECVSCYAVFYLSYTRLYFLGEFKVHVHSSVCVYLCMC